MASGGTLLVIIRIREYDAMLDGLPWALSEKELGEFINLGLKEVQRDVFLSEVGEKKIKQVWIEYCLKT